jgi:hypothetical protein
MALLIPLLLSFATFTHPSIDLIAPETYRAA